MNTIGRGYYGADIIGFFDESFRLIRLRVERKNALNFGETVKASVTDKNSILGGYFAQSKNLPVFIKTNKTLAKGQNICVKIIKEARDSKAAEGVLCPQTNVSQPARPRLNGRPGIISTALIENALYRNIRFADGAVLHMEKTKACWIIDVDSAQSALPLEKLNQAACAEIAAQIVLKNLSGVILIDFAGLKKEAEQKKILEQLKSRSDSLTRFGGFTKTRLCELTRKREAASLFDVFLTPDGQKNALFLSMEIQEKLERKWAFLPVLTVHPLLKKELPPQIFSLCFVQTDVNFSPGAYELKEGNNEQSAKMSDMR